MRERKVKIVHAAERFILLFILAGILSYQSVYAAAKNVTVGTVSSDKNITDADGQSAGKSDNSDTTEKKSGGWTPIQIALFNPVQIASETRDVYGLRFNIIYGYNRDIYGIDTGMVNKAENVYGLQIGVIRNIVKGSMTGIQFSIVNDIDYNMNFMQIGLIDSNVKGNVNGFQTSLRSNTVGGDMTGIQTSIKENIVDGTVTGMQTSIFNMDRGNCYGLQIGIGGNDVQGSVYGIEVGSAVNMVDGSMNGIQAAFNINIVTGFMRGIQIALNANGVEGDITGIQTALTGNFVISERVETKLMDYLNFMSDPAVVIHRWLGGKSNGKGNMTGMQTAIMNGTAGELNGMQTGLFFNVAGDMNGAQVSILKNYVAGRMTGIQLAMIENSVEEATGFQAACYNLQMFNETDEKNYVSAGVQVGLFNYSQGMKGMQIGLVNWAKRMSGIQIGILNIIQNGPVPFMLGINVSTSL